MKIITPVYIKLKARFLAIYKVGYELYDRIDNHHLYLIAAGIAFNILLYIMPLALLVIFLVNQFIGAEQITDALEHILRDVFPPTESTRNLIHKILDEVQAISYGSSTAGWIGLGALLWVSSTLLNSLRAGLNLIFKIPISNVFLLYRLKDILLTVILACFILVSNFFVPLLSFLISFIEYLIPSQAGHIISRVTLNMFSLLSSFMFIFFLYRYVPNKKPPFKTRLFSTLLCLFALESSRQIFGWYVSSVASYGKFYGAYAVAVIIALWLYYTALIILISAETGQLWYEKKSYQK